MEAWFPAASPVRRFDVSEEGLKKRLAQSKVVAHAGNRGLSPNPPMDRDGRREDSGRGGGSYRRDNPGSNSGRWEVGGGLQALWGAPMAACSGCGERDGRIGHGKRRSRTELARVCGDVGLAGGSVADWRRQAGSGMARRRARSLAGNPDSPQAVVFLTSIIDKIVGVATDYVDYHAISHWNPSA